MGKRPCDRITTRGCGKMARPSGFAIFYVISDPYAPGRALRQNHRGNRAGGDVRARQVAEAHQELADDLAAGKNEALAEELQPFFLRPRMVGIEPSGERAMRFTQCEYPLG